MIINPELHVALFNLYRSTRHYQELIALLDDLHDKGNPDAAWEFAKAQARADVTAEYRTIQMYVEDIDRIIKNLQGYFAIGQDF
jgi:hypothetical protein